MCLYGSDDAEGRCHEEGRWVVGNCARLSLLHRAGILGGSEVTAPATVACRLVRHGENVASPRR